MIAKLTPSWLENILNLKQGRCPFGGKGKSNSLHRKNAYSEGSQLLIEFYKSINKTLQTRFFHLPINLHIIFL